MEWMFDVQQVAPYFSAGISLMCYTHLSHRTLYNSVAPTTCCSVFYTSSDVGHDTVLSRAEANFSMRFSSVSRLSEMNIERMGPEVMDRR